MSRFFSSPRLLMAAVGIVLMTGLAGAQDPKTDTDPKIKGPEPRVVDPKDPAKKVDEPKKADPAKKDPIPPTRPPRRRSRRRSKPRRPRNPRRLTS